MIWWGGGFGRWIGRGCWWWWCWWGFRLHMLMMKMVGLPWCWLLTYQSVPSWAWRSDRFVWVWWTMHFFIPGDQVQVFKIAEEKVKIVNFPIFANFVKTYWFWSKTIWSGFFLTCNFCEKLTFNGGNIFQKRWRRFTFFQFAKRTFFVYFVSLQIFYGMKTKFPCENICVLWGNSLLCYILRCTRRLWLSPSLLWVNETVLSIVLPCFSIRI